MCVNILCVHVSVYIYIYAYLSIYLFIYLFIYVSIYLFVCFFSYYILYILYIYIYHVCMCIYILSYIIYVYYVYTDHLMSLIPSTHLALSRVPERPTSSKRCHWERHGRPPHGSLAMMVIQIDVVNAYMELSWVIGVPPVLIHFRLVFPLTIRWGYPIYGNPMYVLWVVYTSRFTMLYSTCQYANCCWGDQGQAVDPAGLQPAFNNPSHAWRPFFPAKHPWPNGFSFTIIIGAWSAWY